MESTEPRYLNPIIQTQAEKANMLIFEGLVGFNAQLEIIPRLATKWELSNGDKTLTFTLRKNVKWGDGEPFTSKDVAFTFKAIRETRAQSIWKAYMIGVENVETPNDHTFVVHYKEPYGLALSTWTVGIIPQHIYGEGELTKSPGNEDPVGTGPYKLARWEKKQRLFLRANRDWWYAAEHEGMPYIETIELLVGSRDSSFDNLTTEKIDFASIEDISEWSSKAQSPEFREKYEVTDVVEARFRAIAWNAKRPHLADKRVRLALTHALNRGRVIDNILLGSAQPLSGPFFPNMFGADRSIAPWPFDLDKAVKLLDEAGYPAKNKVPRFSIDMIALKSQELPVTSDSIAIFRNDLRGIRVELKMTHLHTAEFSERVVDGNYDAVYLGWLPDIPDPDPYSLLHSSMIGRGYNYAYYSNPAADKILEDARATTNLEERKALYHKLHRILHDEMPYTVLYAPFGHYAWNRRVRGVNPNDISSQPRFPGLAGWWIVEQTVPVTPQVTPRATKSAAQ